MNENKVDLVVYTKNHRDIIKCGIEAIRQVLNGTNIGEKRSLLLSLDYYIDPYYGYKLPHHEDIVLLLQERLLVDENEDVKDDIMHLLNYSHKALDYLAQRIEMLESQPWLLSKALYALWHTCDNRHVPIFVKYKNFHDEYVRADAEDILKDIEEEEIQKNKEL